jgi:hypothetical protein
MKRVNRQLLCAAVLIVASQAAFAQVPSMTCTVNAPAPPVVRAEGRAELVSDLVLVCNGGNPTAAAAVNITLFLNTNVTSNLTGPGPDETEALVLIDEPKPSPVLNTSNGFPFVGQVRGTPGVIPSGNVFTGLRTGVANQILFPGIPIVPPGAGTRIIRITNVRAVPSAAGGPVMAFLAVSGPTAIAINNPVQTVGFVSKGLNFSFAPAGVNLNLKFGEGFASAFKKRIENAGGPLTPVKQNQPGAFHCTESGFNPDFTPVTPGATGSANTGTRLVAKITGIPASVAFLVVPNDVTVGQIVAARVPPPSAFPFSSGTPIVTGGNGFVPVAAGTATVVYEIVAAPPYAGATGCATVDTFLIPVQPWPFGSLAGVHATGFLAPSDPTAIISGPAPEPRFQ